MTLRGYSALALFTRVCARCATGASVMSVHPKWRRNPWFVYGEK